MQLETDRGVLDQWESQKVVRLECLTKSLVFIGAGLLYILITSAHSLEHLKIEMGIQHRFLGINYLYMKTCPPFHLRLKLKLSTLFITLLIGRKDLAGPQEQKFQACWKIKRNLIFSWKQWALYFSAKASAISMMNGSMEFGKVNAKQDMKFGIYQKLTREIIHFFILIKLPKLH